MARIGWGSAAFEQALQNFWGLKKVKPQDIILGLKWKKSVRLSEEPTSF